MKQGIRKADAILDIQADAAPKDQRAKRIKIRRNQEGFRVPDSIGFSICALKVWDDCSQKKCLQEGIYFFNDLLVDENGQFKKNVESKVPKDFYGHNISIQAIVGQNGSGKSSILELMYRMINNFSFMLELGMHRNESASKLCYVKGIHASLYFLLDGHIGRLNANGDTMSFHYDGYEQYLDFVKMNHLGLQGVQMQVLDVRNEVVAQATVKAPVARMAEVAKRFFYTIVTNYSMQSYIDNDYKDEKTYIEYRPELEEGKGGKKQVSRKVVERESGDVWISSIFHKNDGYRTPIVLNPYRDEGNIDMYKEYCLSQYRLSTIFIRAEKLDIEVIDGYKLDSIDYTYDPLAVERKFMKQFWRRIPHDREWSDFQNVKDKILTNPNSIAYTILDLLAMKDLDYTKPLYRDAALYMIYKVLAIAAKYPSYYEFEDFGKIESYFQGIDENLSRERLSDLVERIWRDQSHITIKFRQVETLIRLLEKSPGLVDDLQNGTSYVRYMQLMFANEIVAKEPTNLRELSAILPPSFYTIDIKLTKKNDLEAEAISLGRMSSGERQFLYTSSTFIYHILNLMSVQDSRRVRYRNMNLVLDEVEICFHPEYQRQFISKLIEILTKFRLNRYCSINILIATHSPFILSDIPKQNILYLKDGHCANDDVEINPLGANVNDILHQSFFLEHAFMGEYALKRIQNLVAEIDNYGKKGNRNIEQLRQEISLIGDKYLHQQLETLLSFKENLKRNG